MIIFDKLTVFYAAHLSIIHPFTRSGIESEINWRPFGRYFQFFFESDDSGETLFPSAEDQRSDLDVFNKNNRSRRNLK